MITKFPIHLFSLPDNLYIMLQKDFKSQFFNSAIKIAGNKNKFCRLMKISRSCIDKWLLDSPCPLGVIKQISNSILKNITRFNEYEIENNVIELRGKTHNSGIKTPEFPIMLSGELGSLLGHFFGDGGIKKEIQRPCIAIFILN